MEYWHLLSLDAPTVAVAWSWAFATASGVTLHPVSALLLGLATWLLYVADRLLDSRHFSRAEHAGVLHERHHFHARHRKIFLAVALPALCILVWLVLTRMESAPRFEDLVLSVAAGVYLLMVHRPVNRLPNRFLSKEAAVAIIFCIACVIPAWSRQPAAHRWLVCVGVPFALLCWLNCVAIESWEAGSSCATPGALTMAIGRGLRSTAILLAVATTLLALVAALQGHPAYAAVLFSISVSAVLLIRLDHVRPRMTALQLRAAADGVLLTPAIFLLLRYLTSRA